MKNNIKFILLTLVAVAGLAVSCKKTFDVLPEDKLDVTQMYRNVYDADAAIFGLYGKFQSLAKQYVLLNELRGDLMEVTDNADKYLQQINTHSVTNDNPYTSPKPFYDVILNCNDIMKNFNIMLANKKFTIDQYNQRYSDVVALRSFLYLQLGIHYGDIPYVTDALDSVDAVKNTSKYPRIGLYSGLLDSLINTMEALPFKDIYPTSASVIVTVDGLSTYKSFIHKKVLLGDLHLWKGNYNKAADYYKQLMDTYINDADINKLYDQYKVRYADGSSTSNNDICVSYSGQRSQDINSLIDNNSLGWRSIFARPQDTYYNWEWIWQMYFNSNFKPDNPFVEMFANNGMGKYLLKPSQQSVDNWNTQLQSNGFPFDARGQMSWKTINSQPVITKYLYTYLTEYSMVPVSVLQKNGRWFLYRAATVHLHFAEAANRDNRKKLAWSFVNTGINSVYDSAANTDKTNLQNTLTDPDPIYRFDARFGTYPYFRGPWHRHAGLRGRARLNSIPVVGDSTLAIENMAIDEEGLETAYEGQRWPDLVRIALRRKDPAYLADKVYNKLVKDKIPGAAAIRTKLMTTSNWYLPFDF